MICYLIRHGKDDDSVRGGWSQSPLTDEGRQQVMQLAEQMRLVGDRDIGIIYSSDLLRAMETAQILSSALSVPIVEVPEFRETNNGLLAGMNNQTASEQYPELYWSALDWQTPYPGGESPCQFYKRISDAWGAFKRIVRDGDKNIALVTHGGVINVIQCIEHGITYSNKANPFPVPYAGLIPLEIL